MATEVHAGLCSLSALMRRLNGLSGLLLGKLFAKLAADLFDFLSHLFFLAQILLKQAGAIFLAHEIGLFDQSLVGSNLIMLGFGCAAQVKHSQDVLGGLLFQERIVFLLQ